MTDAHRPAAIQAIDVVGYSRRMGEDARPFVAGLGGRIVKTNDDPILARFRAAPDKMYGHQIDRVVLYGSPARGDAASLGPTAGCVDRR